MAKKILFTQKRVLELIKECIKLIEKKPPSFFILKKMKKIQGLCDWEEDALFFDWRDETFRTIVHECVHYLYPDWSETTVIRAESRIINTISKYHVALILHLFSKKILKHYESINPS